MKEGRDRMNTADMNIPATPDTNRSKEMGRRPASTRKPSPMKAMAGTEGMDSMPGMDSGNG